MPRFCLGLVLFLAVPGLLQARQIEIYTTENTTPGRVVAGSIARYAGSGWDKTPVIKGLGFNRIEGLDFDLINGKLYWSDNQAGVEGEDVISVVNLDGTEPAVVATVSRPIGIRVDPINQSIFWADVSVIRQRLADGTIRGLVLPRTTGLATDGAANKLYGCSIWRTDLTVINREDLISTPCNAIELDVAAGKMYWSGGGLRRANLDGTDVETLANTFGVLIGIGVSDGKLYGYTGSGTVTVKQANLDGSNIETLTTIDDAFRLRVDPEAKKIYWADIRKGIIFRSNLDGSDREQFLVSSPDQPKGIAIDEVNGKIYWVEDGINTDEIRRANLDGSDIEVLYQIFARYFPSSDIALDVAGDALYFWGGNSGTFERSRLDGSDVQSFPSPLGPRTPIRSLALDLNAGKLYVTSFRFIGRSNLDGTNPELLFNGSNVNPGTLALDTENGVLYWTSGSGIKRANLDGTDQRTIITSDVPINDIAWGTDGKLYYINGPQLVRANGDGTNIEALATSSDGIIKSLAVAGIKLPVELTGFDAQPHGRDVVLTWATASEENNAGFEVQHLPEPTGDTIWQTHAFVDGAGTTRIPQRYTYRIADLTPGQHRFRLKQIDFDGAFEYSPEVSAWIQGPHAYALFPAYPNPAHPQHLTQFQLIVSERQQVKVTLYNTLGQQLHTVFYGRIEANRLTPLPSKRRTYQTACTSPRSRATPSAIPKKSWSNGREVRSAGCGVRGAGCGVRSAECGVRSAGCGVRGAGCGVRGAGCGVRGAECVFTG